MVNALIAALIPILFVVSACWIAYLHRAKRVETLHQWPDYLMLKNAYMATYMEPPAPMTFPRAAITGCPKCHRICWHEMTRPQVRKRSDWPGLGEEALEFRTWGGGRVRSYTVPEPVDEFAWEVVRVCSGCGVRWGADYSGNIRF